MKTWTEWQQEERRLMEKKTKTNKKDELSSNFKKPMKSIFDKGFNLWRRLAGSFGNDQAFLHEQMQERVFSLSRSTQEHLEVMEEVLQQEKENWKNKSMKSPTKKEKHS